MWVHSIKFTFSSRSFLWTWKRGFTLIFLQSLILILLWILAHVSPPLPETLLNWVGGINFWLLLLSTIISYIHSSRLLPPLLCRGFQKYDLQSPMVKSQVFMLLYLSWLINITQKKYYFYLKIFYSFEIKEAIFSYFSPFFTF